MNAGGTPPATLSVLEGRRPLRDADPGSERVDAAIGRAAPPFEGLSGVDGATYSLETFARFRVVVLAFLGNSCPAAKGCLPQLVDFQARFGPEGVQVVGINPNNPHLSPRDSLGEMVPFSAEHRLGFPYLKDLHGAVARGCGARNTPDFVVLDAERRIRYRGPMFDSREPARATRKYLEEAVRALLGGRAVEDTETPPLGCSIVW